MLAVRGVPALLASMTRRKPTQKRSRERVEQILSESRALILNADSLDALTTSAISERTGMSVATVYRYFSDRYGIIVALLEDEVEALFAANREAVMSLDRVTIKSLNAAIMHARLEYFESNPLIPLIWFSARDNERVRETIERYYRQSTEWFIGGCLGCELINEWSDWTADATTGLVDQTFQTMFAKQRSHEERVAILTSFLEMLEPQTDRYATERGKTGVPTGEYLAAADAAFGSAEDGA